MTERITAAGLLSMQDNSRTDHESPIHKSILEFLRTAFPTAVIHHSPNELQVRGLSKEARQRIIARAKALGMEPGFPDLIMIFQGMAFGFEVKAASTPSDAQNDVMERLDANGCRCAVVRSIDDVQAALEAWGIKARVKLW